ncbi:unnamed protein product [Paramecium pentaurelia]|uniref:Transmembrane protein n=1 Tax=Paramecium pentaurelia TaxID=43138 RepID=A0A8S1TEB2_9CILI|nr:unnamed protein product [Paramecium pentaurelia]
MENSYLMIVDYIKQQKEYEIILIKQVGHIYYFKSYKIDNIFIEFCNRLSLNVLIKGLKQYKKNYALKQKLKTSSINWVYWPWQNNSFQQNLLEKITCIICWTICYQRISSLLKRLGTDKDKLAHVICIATALTFGLIYQILIIVQLERLVTMKERLRPMIQQQFKRFKDIITVVVTHWDKAEEPEKRKKELIDLIKGYSYQKKHLEKIYNCDQKDKICQLYFIKIIIKFYQIQNVENFNFFFFINFQYHNLRYNLILILLIQQMIKGLSQCLILKNCKSNKRFIKNFSETDSTMPEVMHQLTLAVKDYDDEKFFKFEKDNMDLCLISLAQEKMKLSQQQFCPYCWEIQMKVFGCNEQTFCWKLHESEDNHFK